MLIIFIKIFAMIWIISIILTFFGRIFARKETTYKAIIISTILACIAPYNIIELRDIFLKIIGLR